MDTHIVDFFYLACSFNCRCVYYCEDIALLNSALNPLSQTYKLRFLLTNLSLISLHYAVSEDHCILFDRNGISAILQVTNKKQMG